MVNRLLRHKESINEYIAGKTIDGLNESEWQKLQILADLLKLCKNVTEQLGGQKYVSSSLLLPSVAQLIHTYHADDDDPAYICRFKKAITDDLTSRQERLTTNMFLKTSTALDPRFKRLKSIPSSMCGAVWSHITNLVKLEIQSKNNNPTDEEKVSNSKRAKRDYESSDEEDDTSHSSDNPASMAQQLIERYQQQPEVESSADPYIWWNQHRNTFDYMLPIISKHLGCPATSVPSERLFSSAGNVISCKRAAMLPENANEFICLSGWLSDK